MTVRYSDCHFAEVMFAEVMQSRFIANHVGAEPQEVIRCSFCGEPCEMLPPIPTMREDLELTLRRWKDGDCTPDNMFERVNKELSRAYIAPFNIAIAKDILQASGKPKYVINFETLEWEEQELHD